MTKKKVAGRPSTRDEEIRCFVKDLHHSYLPNNEAMKQCSKEAGISLSTIQQAKTDGKGSIETHLSIFLNQTGLTTSNLRKMLPEIRNISKYAGHYSLLEEKLEAVLTKYSVDQVIVILELMLAKEKVESSLGLSKNTSKPRDSLDEK